MNNPKHLYSELLEVSVFSRSCVDHLDSNYHRIIRNEIERELRDFISLRIGWMRFMSFQYYDFTFILIKKV
jgi:hypothetical protein